MQESTSTYELVEVSTGGKLSRHNVHVQLVGSDTVTVLTTFHLSVGDQTQDLHSRIVLTIHEVILNNFTNVSWLIHQGKQFFMGK